jgi:hypothetical protein
MTDLRRAAEMALEALEGIPPGNMTPMAENTWWAVKVHLRQALADPINKRPTKIFGPNLEEILNAAGFYRQSKQEPVAWMSDAGFWEYEQEGIDLVPLYTAPPQREWVGLTDAEIDSVAAEIWGSEHIAPQSCRVFTRAIEAKLKEKNT